MLVQRSVVDRWYQRDSWVFRHFSYLFKNPLWNKNIPNGFSVCPYFWLAMFSMIVLRPTIGFITNVLVPLIGLGGAPLKWLDRWIATKAGAPKNMGTGFGFLLGILGVVLLSIVGWLGMSAWSLYASLATLGTTGQFIFWLFGSGLATLAGVGGYIAKNEDNPDRCRAEIYLYVWLGLAAILCPIFAWADVANIFAGLWGSIVGCVAAVGWAIKTSALWCVGAVWAAVKFLANCLWSAVSYTPFKSLFAPWWVYVGLAGWLSNKLATRFLMGDYVGAAPDGRINSYQGVTTASEQQRDWEASNRRSWLSLLQRCFDSKGGLEMLAESTAHICWADVRRTTNMPEVPPSSWSLPQLERTCGSLSSQIRDRLVEIKFSRLLDRLQRHICWVSFADILLLKRVKYAEDRLEQVITNYIDGLPADSGQREAADLMLELRCSHNWPSFLQPGVMELFDTTTWQRFFQTIYNLDYKTGIREAEQARKKRERGGFIARLFGGADRAQAVCQRVTGSVSKSLSNANELVREGGRQCWTFVVYLWTLAKAKKQGACPYIQFSDPPVAKK